MTVCQSGPTIGPTSMDIPTAYTTKLLEKIAQRYKLKKSELFKRYLVTSPPVKVPRTKKKKAKVLVEHTHPVDNVYHADCVLCNSHGNIMDPSQSITEFEIV